MIDIGFYTFYALLVIAVASAVIFPIVQAIGSPRSLVKSAISIGVIAVLFGVAYAVSGSDVSLKAMAFGIDESSSKLIGAGLIMFYIVLILAVIAIIYSEINTAINK